jgi:hypothetical protein
MADKPSHLQIRITPEPKDPRLRFAQLLVRLPSNLVPQPQILCFPGFFTLCGAFPPYAALQRPLRA